MNHISKESRDMIVKVTLTPSEMEHVERCRKHYSHSKAGYFRMLMKRNIEQIEGGSQ